MDIIQELDWGKAKDFFSKNFDKIKELFTRVSDKYKEYVFRYIERISKSPVVRFTPIGDTFVLKIPLPKEVVVESKSLFYDLMIENKFLLKEAGLSKGLGSIAGSLNEFFVLEKVAEKTKQKWGILPKDVSKPMSVKRRKEVLLAKLEQKVKIIKEFEQVIKRAELGASAISEEIMNQFGDTCRVTEYWWTGDAAAKARTKGTAKEDVSFRVVKEGIDEELIKKWSLKLSDKSTLVNLHVTTVNAFISYLSPQEGEKYREWLENYPQIVEAEAQYDKYADLKAFVNKVEAERKKLYSIPQNDPKQFSLTAPPKKKEKKAKQPSPVAADETFIEKTESLAKFYKSYKKDKYLINHVGLRDFEYDKDVPMQIVRGAKFLKKELKKNPSLKLYEIKDNADIQIMIRGLEETRKLLSKKTYEKMTNKIKNLHINKVQDAFDSILKNPATGNEVAVQKMLEVTQLNDESTEALLAVVKNVKAGPKFDKLVKLYPYLHMRGLKTVRKAGRRQRRDIRQPKQMPEEDMPSFEIVNSDNEKLFKISTFQKKGLLVNFYFEQPKGKKE